MKNKRLSAILSATFIAGILLITGAAPTQALANVGSVNGYTNDLGNDLGLFYVNVAPSSYYVAQGGYVSFNGDHFYPGETVRITSGGTLVGSVTAESNGKIATMPYMVSYDGGNHTYTIVGNKSNIPYNLTIAVRSAQPWLTLNTYYALPGAALSITGHGFGVHEKVLVTMDGKEAGTVLTDENGMAFFNTKVPNALGESMNHTHRITLKGEKSSISATEKYIRAF